MKKIRQAYIGVSVQSLLVLALMALGPQGTAQDLEEESLAELNPLEELLQEDNPLGEPEQELPEVQLQEEAEILQGQPQKATAQSSERLMEEVIVTVERREESLQDYAGTAVSFTGEDMKLQGIQNLADLGDSTPGVADQ